MVSIARLHPAVALLAACLFGTALAAPASEVRSVSEFTALSLSAPIKVQLAQGDRDSVELKGDAKALADIESVVEDRTLRLRMKDKSLTRWDHKVVAIVTMRKVSALAVAGSGDLVAGALRGEAMKLSVSGSGDLRIAELAVPGVEIAIRGSGDVSVAGKVDSLSGSIAGSGDLRAGKLQAGRATVNITGSGSATVWAKDSLAVNVVGSGDVRYYGDPAVAKASIGSGSVRRLGAAPS